VDISHWNSLSNSFVLSPSVASFKCKLQSLNFSPVISVSCLLVTLVTCQSRIVPACCPVNHTFMFIVDFNALSYFSVFYK